MERLNNRAGMYAYGQIIWGMKRVASESPRAPGSYTSSFWEIGQQGDLLANLALLVFYLLLVRYDLEMTCVG
jgi:hypothetical protein